MEKTQLKDIKKNDYKFKAIVESLLESKIRWLCDKFPRNEWSGILFYTTDGNLRDGSLIVHCKDMHLMDYGSATFTDYNEDASIMSYMIENDLFMCNIGIIHSHNAMNSFFSGTDVSTLKQEGNEKDNFFSLIVNNEGKYCCGITLKMNDEIEKAKNVFYFNDFDGEKVIDKETEYEYKDWLVNWSEGSIEKEEPNIEVDFTDRLNEIKESKSKSENKRIITTTSNIYRPSNTDRHYDYGSYWPRYRSYDSYYSQDFDSEYDNNLYYDKFIQLLSLNLFANRSMRNNARTLARMLPGMVLRRYSSTHEYYNALESFSDLVFDDLMYEETKGCLQFCLEEVNKFEPNIVLETFKEWVSYSLSMLIEEEEAEASLFSDSSIV